MALVSGVAAFAQGHMGRGPGMMKRMASAMIDEALEPAQVTPEQRAKIYAVRDRVFASMEAQRQTRGQHMAQALALFEADMLDPTHSRRSPPSMRPSTSRWPTPSRRPSARCTTS